MALTVEAGFSAFFDAINLSGDHRKTANARKDNIVSHLKNDFEILDAFSTGSIPKFTALTSRADLDVMVVLHYGKHIKDRTPAQVLAEVRKPLSQYRTNVRRNGQAVTLYYKSWPDVDIVPVARSLNGDGSVSHYEVPNANTGMWMKSRPQLLSSAIEKKATESGPNFRRIIKMMKHWNVTHSDYLSGYHIEVLGLSVFSGNLDDTPWNVFWFFQEARKLLSASLYYDLGNVDDYLSFADRLEVQKRFDTAIDQARRAWFLTHGGRVDHEGATKIWQQVFGEKFPAYG